MLVRMRQRLVMMGMGMSRARSNLIRMTVQMMFIVSMFVLVIERPMTMGMHMPFGQMKP